MPYYKLKFEYGDLKSYDAEVVIGFDLLNNIWNNRPKIYWDGIPTAAFVGRRANMRLKTSKHLRKLHKFIFEIFEFFHPFTGRHINVNSLGNAEYYDYPHKIPFTLPPFHFRYNQQTRFEPTKEVDNSKLHAVALARFLKEKHDYCIDTISICFFSYQAITGFYSNLTKALNFYFRGSIDKTRTYSHLKLSMRQSWIFKYFHSFQSNSIALRNEF